MGDTETTPVDERDPATAFMQDAIPILGHMGLRVLEGERGAASVLLPHGPNSNHLGTIYAGSLMSAAECLGGSIGFAQGIEGAIPIVARVEIDYLRPASTDVVAATTLSTDHQKQIAADVNAQGKARFTLEITLTDTDGVEVARAVGHYQLRRF